MEEPLIDSKLEPFQDPKEALLPWQEAGFTDKTKSWSLSAMVARTCNQLTIWLLQHPGFFSRIALFIIYLFEAATSNPALGELFGIDRQGNSVYKSRLKHIGPNFCCYSAVVVGEHSKVADLILHPQTRGPYIAWGKQCGRKYPENMLLFMSDKDAGGDGGHEKFKDFVVSLLFSEDVLGRANGPKAKAMIEEFAEQVLKTSKRKTFFGKPTLGNLPEIFIAKFILHVVLGYEPDEKMAKMFAGYFGLYLTQRVIPIGPSGVMCWEKWAEKAIAESPLLANVNYEAVGLTKDYVVAGFMPILFVAALPGPSAFLHYSLPNLPADLKLSSTDHDESYRTVLEVMRLNPPVGTVTMLAQGPVTINIGERYETFPAGTKLCYAMPTAMLDPTVFKNPTKFDLSRTNVADNTVVFAGVGGNDHRRQCPGRKIAENMGAELFMALAKHGWQPGTIG